MLTLIHVILNLEVDINIPILQMKILGTERLCYFPEVYTYFQVVSKGDELQFRYLDSIAINYCTF